METSEKTCSNCIAKTIFSLFLIVLFAAWLYRPFIKSGLPYFYDEDEGHHFNRTVEMVQNGDFNPHYFLKPSLHFYLRMPVTAISFLLLARRGEISKLGEIKTKDKFGLAGYSFTASHPLLASANRAFSVFMTILYIAVVFFIALELSGSLCGAMIASFLTTVAAGVTERAAFIGVDGPMGLFCLLAVYLALRLRKNFSYTTLIGCCIFAGAAISTKYNAAPIYILPLASCILLKRKEALSYIVSIIVPAITFLACSPFILVEFPQFLNHVAYEMWHYATGHAEHTADPGLPQLIHYTKWLSMIGFGILPCLAALFGLIKLFKKDRVESIILLTFPVIYGFLMIMQKTNFERNFIIIIPFVAILASLGLLNFKSCFKKCYLFSIFVILLAAQPLLNSLSLRAAAASVTDSRDEVYNYLINAETKETALSGKLQLPLFSRYDSNKNKILTTRGISRVSHKVSFFDLYQDGYKRLVFGPEKEPSKEELELVNVIKVFDGEDSAQRIPRNPKITIYEFKDNVADKISSSLVPEVSISPAQNGAEDFIWLSKRVSKIKTDHFKLEIRSPWGIQNVSFSNGKDSINCKANEKWSSCDISTLRSNDLITATIEDIRAPNSYGISEDSRRLGVAIR